MILVSLMNLKAPALFIQHGDLVTWTISLTFYHRDSNWLSQQLSSRANSNVSFQTYWGACSFLSQWGIRSFYLNRLAVEEGFNKGCSIFFWYILCGLETCRSLGRHKWRECCLVLQAVSWQRVRKCCLVTNSFKQLQFRDLPGALCVANG
jgi:hypothetical protein